MDDIKEIKDFKVLKLLDRFKAFFERTGVDYKIMRRLLQIMLIMDGRRTPTVMGGQRKKDRGSEGPFRNYLITYGILGLFIMILMFTPLPLFYKMSIILGMVIFMLITTMISDFSSILLDVRDKVILIPRPIGPKTINAAKTLHILIYIVFITAVIAGPALIVGSLKYGTLFFVIFLVQLIFISVFVIFLTSMLYYFILRFFDGEKLKDVINYFQIFLSIAMTIGYQFLGRTFDIFDTSVVFNPQWWTYFIPSVWFAGPYGIFIENSSSYTYIILSVLSILIPVLLFILYYTWISPYFEKNLDKLSRIDQRKSGIIEKRGELKRRLAGLLCFNRTENIFYRFTRSMISNERQFKLKLFPNLAYAAIFPFIFVVTSFTGGRPFSEVYLQIIKFPYYLLIYLSVMLLSGLFMLVYSSDKYKGAWIYRALPIENPGTIYKGIMKAFLSRYVIPVFLFPCIIFSFFYGVGIIPHEAVMLVNLLILTLVIFMLNKKQLPFSMEFMQQQRQNSGCIIYIASFAYCGVSAVLQYFLRDMMYGLVIYISVLLVVFLILWNRAFKIKWKDI